ncbi:MAG: acyl-CoA/acyl-ACP dehydrogenase [Gammaproteobacteria bacterium]|nr:acyl-CoA/acyl-ACP dehydrogenase [Gammaproteobacteria bacterium]MDA7969520.1 acyl-CoA/acyl-ACP dehydrogenase [Gammaproteobacteria bacterium]MDA7972380.1 acyl-CoA/acyl-ACP dehydrogenase [Gammaproteobacteria bacterium]MDA8022618.1 acyl-CoA/acyl-ACP dehydrogenase [Gammaproteobacteria bacterium]CAJ2375717.1 MAG: Butyryl-CoA dehydrogenase [Arenicellales bacterium IbO2]
MNFSLTESQRLLIETARRFVEEELYPHEAQVEKSGKLDDELRRAIIAKSREVGLYAANMPEELGGGGLDTLSMCLLDRELGRASMALQYTVARPSNILQACAGDQREKYLLPCIRGEKVDCLAMTEPGAGSDVRSMSCAAKADGGDFVITGAKHFISHADIADFVILFAATGVTETARGPRKKITAFLIDKGTPGFQVRAGYDSVSHRGYHNCILEFDRCRVPASQILGEADKGFEVANSWLGNTRLQVAAICLGRCDRAHQLACEYAATRKQFNQTIGKFQGVAFKLADMEIKLRAAELLVMQAAWREDHGGMSDMDAAIAKLAATEALAFIADEALQIHGGMGLMTDLPLERIWRDARVERIWEGTSEIQRMIISRAILRPLES